MVLNLRKRSRHFNLSRQSSHRMIRPDSRACWMAIGKRSELIENRALSHCHDNFVNRSTVDRLDNRTAEDFLALRICQRKYKFLI